MVEHYPKILAEEEATTTKLSSGFHISSLQSFPSPDLVSGCEPPLPSPVTPFFIPHLSHQKKSTIRHVVGFISPPRHRFNVIRQSLHFPPISKQTHSDGGNATFGIMSLSPLLFGSQSSPIPLRRQLGIK